MSKHRQQHTVPASYLKAWCDPASPPNHKPYVWVFPKDSRAGRKKSPEKIFREHEFYTVGKSVGRPDHVVEHNLAMIERAFSQLRVKKLERERPLDQDEHHLLCTFIAAMHQRTPSHIQRATAPWARIMEIGRDMEREMAKLSPEERRRQTPMPTLGVSSGPSMTLDDAQLVIDEPVAHLMVAGIAAEAQRLPMLDVAIFTTDTEPGFITSNSPAVWCDPDAYKRAPVHRYAALLYPSIEITLPVSPRVLILLNRQGREGYEPAKPWWVEELNRRTRAFADDYIVVNSNTTRDRWYEEDGPLPEDAWENRNPPGDRERP